ncbi:MAG: hypothetical protein AAFR04_08130, partial [Pseudomonadota bacterium]
MSSRDEDNPDAEPHERGFSARSSASDASALNLHDSALHAPAPCDPSALRSAKGLESVVGAEIIPRLMVLHRELARHGGLGDTADPSNAAPATGPGPSLDVEHFARLTLHSDADPAFTYIDTLLANGISVDDFMMNLLAPTARLLGQWWEDDDVDFVDVTIGTTRLQQAIHRFVPHSTPISHPQQKRILLAPAPDEQHCFGLTILSEVMRARDWHVAGGNAVTQGEVEDLVARESWDIVGFSLANMRLTDALREA